VTVQGVSGDPPSRALRAGLGAAIAVGFAVAFHAAAHGGVAATSATYVFLALLGPSWMLAGRERSWWMLALTQLGGQQVAHVVLSALAPDAAHLVPADLMLYAHLVAAALSALWLWRGERQAWAAARRLVAAVLHRVEIPAARPARTPIPPRAAEGPHSLLLRHAVLRRGPPLMATEPQHAQAQA
jgi:hypothetical protein